MESSYVYCDWTLVDAIGRFVIFCLWGYTMGKSVVHSKKTTWSLTFAGVLIISFIHTWMQAGELNQAGIYLTALNDPVTKSDEPNLILYFIKIFFFYLTASIIGFNTGRKKAKKTKKELNKIQETLNTWEKKGFIDKK